MEVAFSKAADPDLLAMLGGERGSAQVRCSLAEDKDDQVRHAVAFNGATPETLLTEIAGRSLDLAILVAMNPDVPGAVLEALTQDGNPLVRFIADGRQSGEISSNAKTRREH